MATRKEQAAILAYLATSLLLAASCNETPGGQRLAQPNDAGFTPVQTDAGGGIRDLGQPIDSAFSGGRDAVAGPIDAARQPAMPSPTLFVDPAGDDAADGRSPSAALQSIQTALDRAMPGDHILLAAGNYVEHVETRRAGTQTAPIVISGPAEAILRGPASDGHIFDVFHSDYWIVGFTIDGHDGQGDAEDNYRDKLLYLHGKLHAGGIRGIRVLRMHLKNAGGECLRLRYFVRESEIAESTFETCGLHDYRQDFSGDGKNGEAIYIGTSSKQWHESDKNPTNEPDQSSDNWVHHNVMRTHGNECVDIKEGAERNLIEHNRCADQLDPESACYDARGDSNIFRYNSASRCTGACVRLGGHTVDGHTYGVLNQVYANACSDIQHAAGIKIMVEPQGLICGNPDMTSTITSIDPAVDCPQSAVGDAGISSPDTGLTAPDDADAASVPISYTITANAYELDNPPQHIMDGNLNTRWSGEGDGATLTLQLSQPASIVGVDIAYHDGDQRTAQLTVETRLDGGPWIRLIDVTSSGNTLGLQPIDVTPIRIDALRIVGHGNSENAWNSLTELRLRLEDGRIIQG